MIKEIKDKFMEILMSIPDIETRKELEVKENSKLIFTGRGKTYKYDDKNRMLFSISNDGIVTTRKYDDDNSYIEIEQDCNNIIPMQISEAKYNHKGKLTYKKTIDYELFNQYRDKDAIFYSEKRFKSSLGNTIQTEQYVTQYINNKITHIERITNGGVNTSQEFKYNSDGSYTISTKSGIISDDKTKWLLKAIEKYDKNDNLITYKDNDGLDIDNIYENDRLVKTITTHEAKNEKFITIYYYNIKGNKIYEETYQYV